MPSIIQFSGGPTGGIWWRWSIIEIELKPELSAVVAISTSLSKNASGGVSGQLKFGTCRSS